mgnify:CR=1 FL=1
MFERRTLGLFFVYLQRALRLRCPCCGKKPLFEPVLKVRTLRDWFAPLDGCPFCGYPYEREAGYYLMAIWAVNYGCGSVLGIILYLGLEWQYDLPIKTLLAAVLIPICVFNILFARHAKALFLAVDLFFDPHERGDDGGRGNVPAPRPPVAPPAPAPRDKPSPVAHV